MNKNYQTIKITENFSLLVDNSEADLKLSDNLLSRIDEIWSKEVSQNPSLFNGKFLNLKTIGFNSVIGQFYPYKLFLAHQKDQRVKNALQLCPICVSGITLFNDQILIGKRSSSVTQYPNFYELAPSGGIDPFSEMNGEILISNQILMELEEETGFKRDQVDQIENLFLIYDKVDPFLEVCVKLELHNAQNIPSKSHEYSELFWIQFNLLPSFIEKNEFQIVPLSLEFYNEWFTRYK